MENKLFVLPSYLNRIKKMGQGEGSMDASNMLKPALARGTLRCCGATTIDEYRKVQQLIPCLLFFLFYFNFNNCSPPLIAYRKGCSPRSTFPASLGRGAVD